MNEAQPIPSGLCECGCGQRTKISDSSNATRGWVAGQPRRFLHGHGNRVRRKTERIQIEDRGYESSCWIWQLKIDRDGYGREWFEGGDHPAHRLAWERANGPISSGLQIDHLCRVRSCVRPDHLEPVTCAENIRRGSQTKLTAEDARSIRRMRKEGCTLVAIAEHFSMSVSGINNVVYGTRWRGV